MPPRILSGVCLKLFGILHAFSTVSIGSMSSSYALSVCQWNLSSFVSGVKDFVLSGLSDSIYGIGISLLLSVMSQFKDQMTAPCYTLNSTQLGDKMFCLLIWKKAILMIRM